MKWFALATCVFYFYFLLEGDWGTKAQVAAGSGEFPDLFRGGFAGDTRGGRGGGLRIRWPRAEAGRD